MPTLDLEKDAQSQGFSLVAGLDEAGRGPLAGPVTAAAVVLPTWPHAAGRQPLPSWLSLVDDSKKLTSIQRERALELIQTHALAIGLGMATSQEIDSEGISEATRMAMGRAIHDLPVWPSYLLIDFVKLPEIGIPYQSMAHGDSLCYSIAAASIVAKVSRDRWMEDADTIYPGYGFFRHKGYPTPQHLHLLALQGPSPIHRHSFAPLRTGTDSQYRRVRRNPSGLSRGCANLEGVG